ncbi:hypothetical protein F511_12701 [Dorcoceras hygrometricum]|uniref:Reverse transcriptase Ty1/copia-type domain-containing protein n=1 Tax=Dorcoceras hygrometricum TaxID=472368 RepID=A0A2Z7DF39_9LAMI|nr:hypothetical protein F511_12701 [Dorcoceras hygrometricum]
MGQLDDEGHNVTFGDGSWKVSKGAMIVAQGKKTGTLYMTSSCRDTLAAVDAGANSSLWHYRLGHMSNNDFLRCEADHCCYVKKLDGSYIILLLYVDDMLIAGSCREEIDKLKKELSKKFAMKDLGAAKQILGMRIIRDRVNGILKLSQGEYVKKVVSRFNMTEAKPVSTPLASHFKLTEALLPSTKQEQDYMNKVPYASVVGSLMYAMVCTRPDIAHAVGVVSRFMSNPADMLTKTVTTDKLKLCSTSVGLLV